MWGFDNRFVARLFGLHLRAPQRWTRCHPAAKELEQLAAEAQSKGEPADFLLINIDGGDMDGFAKKNSIEAARGWVVET